MAKTNSGKKEKTAMALADTLSAFANQESDETVSIVDAAEAPPETSETTQADQSSDAEESPSTSKTKSPEKVVRSGGGLRAKISNLMMLDQPQPSLEVSGEELRARLKAWLENLSLRGKKPDKQQAALIKWFLLYLESFSLAELELFGQQWAQHCTGLGFELWWLLDDTLRNSTFKPHLERIALNYIESYRQTEQIQEDVDLFKIYTIWLKNLDKPEYKGLNQTLFVTLSNQGLIPAPPHDIWFASENTRDSHIRQALLNAAEKDTDTFLNCLLKVI